MSTIEAGRGTTERAAWRTVAVPSEHGGWGLTLEPVLLGLIIAWSVSGLALGVAAFAAFLVRTPLKLVLIDLRRRRWLGRSRLAAQIAAGEVAVLGGAVVLAGLWSGTTWLVPAAFALPLVAVEMWFDIRSRGRRLVPELCGAIGIAAVVAVIVLAAGRDFRLAIGSWLVLSARAVGAIPFVRVQIMRLRRGHGEVWQSDLAQACSVGIGIVAILVDTRLAAGCAGVAVLALLQTMWVRRPPIAAKQLGLRQMALGIGLVAMTAAGVLW